MNLDIVPVTRDDRARLEALLELYVYDFSELLGFDVADDGRFRVPPVDAYFADPRCHAFLFRVDDRLAGFALVHRRSRLAGDESATDMAEFFVLRKYRRRRVGERAATSLFDRFPGVWEVRQKPRNHAATAFWCQVIGRYTNDRFERLTLDDERWRGPAQRFTTP